MLRDDDEEGTFTADTSVCEECLHPSHCRNENFCENYCQPLGKLPEEEEGRWRDSL